MILNELKALANEKRLKILYVLAKNDFCQIHIIELTGLNQVDASRSLKTLVDTGLVDCTKRGNRVIYSLSKKMRNEYKSQLDAIINEYNYLSFDVDIDEYAKECEDLVANKPNE